MRRRIPIGHSIAELRKKELTIDLFGGNLQQIHELPGR